jgi:hypothetical protein
MSVNKLNDFIEGVHIKYFPNEMKVQEFTYLIMTEAK